MFFTQYPFKNYVFKFETRVGNTEKTLTFYYYCDNYPLGVPSAAAERIFLSLTLLIKVLRAKLSEPASPMSNRVLFFMRTFVLTFPKLLNIQL